MDGFLANSLFSHGERSGVRRSSALLVGWLLCGGLFCACSVSAAQVFTVEREHPGGNIPNLTTLQPTSVRLGSTPITTRSREELIRLFQSEQAFAVRPMPLGKQGLILHANGPLSPSGHGYMEELEKYGISSKPGDRIVITKFEVKPDRILFEFNGGPEKSHNFLRHVSVGGGMGTSPVVRDDGRDPVGSRFSLVFEKFVPEINAAELRALISPMLDFSLKTPVQAFADTLPPQLKKAILDHEVLVGMNREMVINAMGVPDQKVRETDGKVPFEEWIYGTPPHEVQFVRFNGDRVIRLEIADVGQKPIIRDQDETNGYSGGVYVHQVRVGDAPPTNTAAGSTEDSDRHAAQAPPTLRQPGETLPDAVDQTQVMKPVQHPPKDSPDALPPSSGETPSEGTPPSRGTTSSGGTPSPATAPGQTPAGSDPAGSNPQGLNAVASSSGLGGPP
jgi:hypothetical protein